MRKQSLWAPHPTPRSPMDSPGWATVFRNECGLAVCEWCCPLANNYKRNNLSFIFIYIRHLWEQMLSLSRHFSFYVSGSMMAATVLNCSSCIWFVAVCCWIALTAAFNVDVKAPLVKYGNVDSYFGFSVAQHNVNEDTGVSSMLVFTVQTINPIAMG